MKSYYTYICLSEQDNNNVVVCDDKKLSSLSWVDVLQQIFTFSKNSYEQFFIVNVNISFDAKELESAIDQVCEEHQSGVEGVDEFAKNEVKYKSKPFYIANKCFLL